MMQVTPAMISHAEQQAAPVNSQLHAALEEAKKHRNVRAVYVFQVSKTLYKKVSLGAVFDLLLWELPPRLLPEHLKNVFIGVAQSVPAVASLITTPVTACLVDAWPERRARLVLASSPLCVLAILAHAAALLTDQQVVVLVMLALWGIFLNFSSVSTEAMFTDAIPEGQRDKPTVKKHMMKCLGGALSGVILLLVGMAAKGGGWKTINMKITMVMGYLLLSPSIFYLLQFRDPEIREGNGEQRKAIFENRCVPVLITVSDFIRSLGNGMFVKFLNLWLIKDLGCSMVWVGILQIVNPAVTCAIVKTAERVARSCGRAQVSLALIGGAAVCLWLMATTTWLPAVSVVFSLEEAMAKSSFAISRSILADFTASEQRGRWSAATKFTTMVGSGTALLGGLLADRFGRAYNFRVTAGLYVLAWLVHAPLLCLVPRRQNEEASKADEP